jgi:hypothetical protein
MNNTIKYDTSEEFHAGCLVLTMAGAVFHADGSALTITITGY